MSDIKSGSVFRVSQGGTVTVVNYINSRKVIVKHNDKYGHNVAVQADQLRAGRVKNPFAPNVYGVGFVGVGRYKARSNGKKTEHYAKWHSMMQRCYDPDYLGGDSSYSDVKVIDEWHNFQNFAEWYEGQEHKGLGYHLDKDILVNGNKIYAPNNCCLVPQELNAIILDAPKLRGDCNKGVFYHKRDGVYIAALSVKGRQKELGRFACQELAHKCYVKAKEAYVKSVSEKWLGRVDDRVIRALREWRAVL